MARELSAGLMVSIRGPAMSQSLHATPGRDSVGRGVVRIERDRLTAKHKAFFEAGLRGDAKRGKSAEKTVVGGQRRRVLGPRPFHLSARKRRLQSYATTLAVTRS